MTNAEETGMSGAGPARRDDGPGAGRPERGAAGRADDDVRSDLRVDVTVRETGGLRVELRSKVEALYGTAIEREVRDTLEALGAEHAEARVDDRGALPWVVAARVEAAARRAGVRGGDARPPRTVPDPGPSDRHRRRRSRLYLPGDQPKFMPNAALHGPDAVILDLEDSVHPDEKDAARILVRNALRCVDFGAAERMVRINPLPLGREDVEAVVPEGAQLLLLPKAERPEAVRELETLCGELVERPVWILPILETALGVERAFEIAAAAPSVIGLTPGLEDYTADLGVARTPEGVESAWARARIVNAARAVGAQPIDSVWADVADEEGLRAWAASSRALGFVGMGCLHPRQVALVHAGFAPTEAELEKARAIAAAWERARAEGRGVVTLGSRMIDPPVVKRALRLLEQAEAGGGPDSGAPAAAAAGQVEEER